MKWNLITLCAAALSIPAFAADDQPAATDTQEPTEAQHVQAALHDALEQHLDVPKTPPTLPDQASERATYVHENIAFGKQGEAMKAAHAEAEQRGLDRAREVTTAAGDHAARGLNTAEAQRAKNDSGNAAGRARSEASRGGSPINVPHPVPPGR